MVGVSELAGHNYHHRKKHNNNNNNNSVPCTHLAVWRERDTVAALGGEF